MTLSKMGLLLQFGPRAMTSRDSSNGRRQSCVGLANMGWLLNVPLLDWTPREPFRCNTLRAKLVAFDLDGTLVQERSSWTKIHCHFGVEDIARSNMPLYESGKIDY